MSRSFSLQTWEHGDLGIEQIEAIYAIDSNIFITIPIVNTENDINERMITYAVSNNMRINITAIYTFTQLNIAYEYLLRTTNDAIVSIFAGGISDSGIDPSMLITHAKRLFKSIPHVQILWAGCRELYSIKRAEEFDCDIISVPGDILDKLHLFNTDLDKMSVNMVKDLRDHAIRGGITIEGWNEAKRSSRPTI
jgi:transaldolase